MNSRGMQSAAALAASWVLAWWPLQHLLESNTFRYPWPGIALGASLIANAAALGYLLAAWRGDEGRKVPALWLFTLSFFACDLTTRTVYFALTPGVPDAGQIPNPMIPWFFWRYRSGSDSLLTSPSQLLVWLAACLSYLWPPALAIGTRDDRRDRRSVIALVALLFASAAWRLWGWTDLFFVEQPYHLTTALSIVARELGWLAALITLGVALGLWLARRRRLANAAFR